MWRRVLVMGFVAVVMMLGLGCRRNPFDVDVSHVKVDLDIVRFDREFCQIRPDSIYVYLPRWQQEYGYFWQVYSQALLGLGKPESYDYLVRLKGFFDYCHQYGIDRDVQKAFPPDDEFLTQKLTDAFRHYRYYFPGRRIPRIFTVISGFNVSVFTGDGFVGISLDKYLGSDYVLYPNLGFEKYKRRRMTRGMIPVDVMRAWAVAEFPFNDSVNNVLANMVYEGRLQYFLDAMLPGYPDTLKWGYTELQWKWANAYEKNIWDYLVEKNVLFSQRALDIKTFTGDGPFTTPFHHNSAPRAGTFIGYRIVQAFMKNHPDVTLGQLMEMKDYIRIYNESYYEP